MEEVEQNVERHRPNQRDYETWRNIQESAGK